MPTLLIINGYAGTGKSSVAKMFAEKNNYALLSQDIFLFQFNTIKDTNNGLTKEEHFVAVKNMYDCTLNYMRFSKDIVVEGALVSISEKDPLDVRDFIRLGKKLNYKVIITTFIADDGIREQREKERNYIVPQHIDQLLRKATQTIDEKIEGELVIDTSNMSVDEVVKKLEGLVF